MKGFRFLLLTILSMNICQAQDEYKIHLAKIDTAYSSAIKFVNYVIENSLSDSSDVQFISHRGLLPKLKYVKRDSSKVIFNDTLKTGEICEIEINFSEFDSTEHKIVKDQEHNFYELIDGQYPYGGEYVLPDIEISSMSININGREMKIPKSAYSNFYDVKITDNFGFARKIEAFSSIDGNYIYVYLYGGQAASTYFTKLIFDKEKYITQIVSDYYDLSINSSFRANFIGY